MCSRKRQLLQAQPGCREHKWLRQQQRLGEQAQHTNSIVVCSLMWTGVGLQFADIHAATRRTQCCCH